MEAWLTELKAMRAQNIFEKYFQPLEHRDVWGRMIRNVLNCYAQRSDDESRQRLRAWAAFHDALPAAGDARE
jgi:hypothetical protein